MTEPDPHDRATEAAFPNEVRRRRLAAGLSQAQLANRIGYSREYVSRAERASKGLASAELARALDDALAADGHLVALHSAARHSRTARRNGAIIPTAINEFEARRPSDWPSEEADDVRRRRLLGLAAGAVGAAFVASAEPIRRSLDNEFSAPTTKQDADEWDRVAHDYAHTVARAQSDGDLAQMLADLDELKTRIALAPDELCPRLIRTAGLLAGLTALAFINAGYPRQAQPYWRTAQRAADTVADRPLACLIRGRRAVLSLYSSASARPALGLADEVVSIAGPIACSGLASAYAARAQAFALEGQHSVASHALGDLERLFDRLPAVTTEDRSSLWGWSEQRLHHVRSFVHSFAGSQRRAGEAQDAAISLYPASNYQGPTQIRLHQAVCATITGDAAAGTQAITAAIKGIPERDRRDGLIRSSVRLTLAALPERAMKEDAIREARHLLAGVSDAV